VHVSVSLITFMQQVLDTRPSICTNHWYSTYLDVVQSKYWLTLHKLQHKVSLQFCGQKTVSSHILKV